MARANTVDEADERRRLLWSSAAIFAVAFLPRMWLFTHTAGLLFGCGGEEAIRDLCARQPLSQAMQPAGGPFPIALSHFIYLLIPPAVYVGRWLSLLTGAFTPVLLFWMWRRESLPAAVGAAVALSLAAPHIYFSTLGIAEALSMFLVVAAVLCLEVAAARREGERAGEKWGWSLLGVALLSAATLTRYETWVAPAVLVPYAVWRLRLAGLPWLAVGGAQWWWLDRIRPRGTGEIAVPDLVARQPVEVAIRNLQDALATLHLYWGEIGLALAVVGFIWVVAFTRRRGLAPTAVVVAGFILVMMRLGKTAGDVKYAMNVTSWIAIFVGLGVGGLADLAYRLIGRFTWKKGRGAVWADRARWIVVGLVVPVPLLALTIPGMHYLAGRVLVDEGPRFDDDRQFMAALPALLDQVGRPDEGIWFITGLANMTYANIYLTPKLRPRHMPVPYGTHGSVGGEVTAYFNEPQPGPRQSHFLVVTEPYGGIRPPDDLFGATTIDGFRVTFLAEKYGFRVYRIEGIAESEAPSAP